MTDANVLDDAFNFELVSPEQKLISEPAYMAVIPGEEGEFSVLPKHSSVISSIKPGVVTVYKSKEDTEPRRIFTAGGFADVTGEQCTVLVEEAISVADLNEQELEQMMRNLEEDLSLAEGKIDKARIEKNLKLVKAKLQAVTGHLVI